MKPAINPDSIRGEPKCSGKDCRQFHDTTTMNDECYEDLSYVEIGDTCVPGVRQQRDDARRELCVEHCNDSAVPNGLLFDARVRWYAKSREWEYLYEEEG